MERLKARAKQDRRSLSSLVLILVESALDAIDGGESK